MKHLFFILLAVLFSQTTQLTGQNADTSNNHSILPNNSCYYSLPINNTIILSVKENNSAICRFNNSLIMGAIMYDKINNAYSFISHNRNNNFEFTFVKFENGIKINSWKNPPVNISKDVVLIPTLAPQNKTELLNSWFTKNESTYKLSFVNARILNDKANYLCQSSCFNEALMITKLVMKYAPNVIETYVTRGDAFWGTGDKNKASINYTNYVDIMKALHRENKIPARVLDRINDFELSSK